MTMLGYKGGSGSSSRVLTGTAHGKQMTYTVGALVQANYGAKRDLRIGGVPVGRLMMEADGEWMEYPHTSSEGEGKKKDGSIIVILATDAPLHPLQLQRLAKRATIGLARTGGFGSNSSGDIFLAFSTAAEINPDSDVPPRAPIVEQNVDVVRDATISGLFECAADAVEEAIYNALCMAEDMVGPLGREAKAIDLERLRDLMEKYL